MKKLVSYVIISPLTLNEVAKARVQELISYLRNLVPSLFPKLSIGGKHSVRYGEYLNSLQKQTHHSTNYKTHSRLYRNNGNAKRNTNRTVTIAYGEDTFPDLSTKTTAPPSHSSSTPLTKPNS
jgi:hypothetical protein